MVLKLFNLKKFLLGSSLLISVFSMSTAASASSIYDSEFKTDTYAQSAVISPIDLLGIEARSVSVSNWHTTLSNKLQNFDVGQSFAVAQGSTVTIKVDQYVVGADGKQDKSKTAKVNYLLYNTLSQKGVPFTVDGNVGGANGVPTSATFTNMNAGTYVVRVSNPLDAKVAIGGNVYVD